MVNKSDKLSLCRQCELLSINRGFFYYTPLPESKENQSVMNFLDEQYLKTPFYGVKRLRELVCSDLGISIGNKRLRRLMSVVDWRTLYPKKHTTTIAPESYKYPYLLKGLSIERPNQVWEIDITYVRMNKGYVYMFAIIYVFSRYIVGWSLSNTMTAEWCVETIKSALSRYGKPEIINSDQGSQFTSNIYVETFDGKDMKEEDKVRISMDGKGRATDNIYIERFWRTVKYEHIYLTPTDSVNERRKGIAEFVRFYNRERLHSSLEYRTPMECYSKMSA